MDNKKFEQLIDLIINENEEQARAMFHDIVVEKSREIYESLMDEEFRSEDQVETLQDEINAEEVAEGDDEFADIDDGEGEETELSADEFGGEEAGEEELEDRVVDLEDKLDELMAEFEELMGQEGGEEAGAEEEFGGEEDFGGEEAGDEMMEAEEEEEEESLEESVQLQKVSVTHGDNGQNTKSIVSGGSKVSANGAKAVSLGGGDEKGRTAPSVKDIPGTYKNAPGQKGQKLDTAPKAKAGDDGQNTKSIVGESRKTVKKIVK